MVFFRAVFAGIQMPIKKCLFCGVSGFVAALFFSFGFPLLMFYSFHGAGENGHLVGHLLPAHCHNGLLYDRFYLRFYENYVNLVLVRNIYLSIYLLVRLWQ